MTSLLHTLIRRFAPRTTTNLLIAAVAAGSLAHGSVALAGPGQPRVVVYGGPIVVRQRVECCPAPERDWAQHEFDRGTVAGRADGNAQGYRDGLAGRCFSPEFRCDSRLSRPFRDGYSRTFECAYREAYDRGRCERLAQLERERCRLERERAHDRCVDRRIEWHVWGRW
jgi:hypothetical protein